MSADTTPRITTEVQIMFFDTDCAGSSSNIAYLRYHRSRAYTSGRTARDGLVGMAERARVSRS
jgi:hypothetical protein